MIYAIRIRVGVYFARQTLVEFGSEKQFLEVATRPNSPRYRRVDSKEAHRWVLDGKEHETGLWVDDGKVRYARSEEAKAEGEIHSPSDRSAPNCESTPRIDQTSDGAREPNNETINLG